MSSFDEKEAVREIMRGIDHPVIVELGAHLGEEAEWLGHFNHSRYVMVEADPLNYAEIANKALRNSTSIQGLIAARTGVATFYASHNHAAKNRASGSIRKPTGHLKHFPEVTFHPVPRSLCFTLDYLAYQEGLFGIDFLWCDIQGAERDMIQGGGDTLAKTRYMMIEAEPEVELYEGQALKPELIAMLPGWEVLRDFGYNLLMRNTKCER